MLRDKKRTLVPNASFPVGYTPKNERDSVDFGRRIGQAIQYEWFDKASGSSRFYSRYHEIRELRSYANGTQNTDKHKTEMTVNGDMSLLNLDWSAIPIIPKFVDIVVSGLNGREFTPLCNAIDAMSQEERNTYQDSIEAQMVSKDMLKKLGEAFGNDPFTMPEEELPEDDEALNLHMQMKYKPRVEIAQEIAIQYMLKDNDHVEVREKVDRDQVVTGLGVIKHDFLYGRGTTIEYVDVQDFIYSDVQDNYFRDMFYCGEVKRHVPIVNLTEIKPDITPSELDEVQKCSTSWYGHYQQEIKERGLDTEGTCNLLHFRVKLPKKKVIKVRKTEDGNERAIEREDTFAPPPEVQEQANFEVVEKMVPTWYKGVLVLGTDIVLEWHEMKNQTTSAGAHGVPMSGYIPIAPRYENGQFDSLVKRMMPLADRAQVIHMKIQQVANRVVPDGIYLDADGLVEIDLGNGAEYNPSEAINMYFQTGSVIGRSNTTDGEYNHGKVPVKELSHSSGVQKISSLIQQLDMYIEQMRLVTGIPKSRDGSDIDPRSLVGVQKLAALNSNIATRHILNASLWQFKTLCEGLSTRVKDIMEFSDFADEFAHKVGKHNAEVIRSLKDVQLRDFAIFVEISPDAEQKAQLEERIGLALKAGQIDLDDAMDIQDLNNVKLANQLLKYRKRKKQADERAWEMKKKEADAQFNMQQSQLAAENKAMTIQLEQQKEIAIRMADWHGKAQYVDHEAKLKSILMNQEFELNMKLKGVEVDGLMKKEEMKENRKDDRVTMQSEQQSELIAQRKNNLPPVKFESNEDTLDGFGLEEFGPK